MGKEISVENLKEVITAAVEGGIGYWAILCNDTDDYVAAREKAKQALGEKPCYCDTIYQLLVDGGKLYLEDAEDEGELYSLDYKQLLKGIKMWEKENHTTIKKAIDNSEFDAEDGDTIFQYAVFGEVVYG